MKNTDQNHKGHRKRLRTRYINAGISAFSDHEILELLLAYSIPRRDTKEIAKKLLNQFGSLKSVLSQPPEMLQKVDGIGEKSSVLLSISGSVGSAAVRPKEGVILDSFDRVKEYLKKRFRFQRKEQLIALLLDSSNRLLATKTIDTGTVDRAVVHPRNLVEQVIQTGATALILVHNHPGGRTEPSREDLELTKQLAKLGRSLGFQVLDHLIVAGDSICSMKQLGFM
jgi:DNA repair protein RadC